MSSRDRESVRVLEECMDLQRRKSRDYQNEKSNVKQAMHYRRGVSTIHDMISQKLLRAQSLLEAYENGDTDHPNFEGLEDTYKDLINYASFAVSYLRCKMEGQDPNCDMINRPLYRGFTDLKGPSPEVFELRRQRNEDTSGGSATGEIDVESDGFITVFPALLGAGLGAPNVPAAKIPLSEGDGDTPESRIKGAYLKRVAPRGRVELPDGESICTDNVAITREKMIKNQKRSDIQDMGDRIEEDFGALAKNRSEKE